MHMNSFSEIYVRLINLLARLFGAFAFLAGIVFLLSAYAFQGDRGMHILLGLFLIAVGLALFIAKPVRVEIVANIRRRADGSE
jgi:cytochrome c biogenesis factor